MIGIVLALLANALAVVVVASLRPEWIRYDSWTAVGIFAVVVGLLNAFLRPVVRILTAPIGCLTLGLFSIVINGLMFWIAAKLALGVGATFLGATVTALVALIAVVTNFVDFNNPIVPGSSFGWWGAWLVVVVVPAFMWLFTKVHEHYQHAREVLALPPQPDADGLPTHVVVVPISQLNRATVRALQYAKSISPNGIAVHISIDDQKARELEEQWHTWGQGVPLTIIRSPYRSLQRPLLRFLAELKHVEHADVVTVVLPEYVPNSWWAHALHSQSALRLKGALLFAPGFVVTSVPYHERRAESPNGKVEKVKEELPREVHP